MLDGNNRSDKAVMRLAGVIAAGTAVNVVLAFLAYRFELPLYIDTIGTVVVSAMAGLFPGILTAVATNALCGIFNNYSVYYTIINILIAITTVWYVGNGRMIHKKKIPAFILLLALYGGILGTAIQWLLIGQPQFKDVIDVSEFITAHTHIPYAISSTLINIGLNIVDKGLSVGAALLILQRVSDKMIFEIRNSGWRQTPLNDEKIKALKRMKYGKHSLNRRLTIMLTVASVMIAFVTTYAGIALYFGHMKGEYKENAIKAARFARDVVNAEMVDEYISSGEKAGTYNGPGYRETTRLFDSIKNSIPGIEYLYVYRIDNDGCRTVFDTDENFKENGVIGQFQAFDQSFMPYIPTLLAGEKMDVLENDDTFGYFLTAYEPIYNSEGRCVAYAGADASMSYMHGYMRDFTFRVMLIFAGFLILVLAYGMWMSRYFLVYPIGSMTALTNAFKNTGSDQENLDKDVKQIKELDITTGDEVEELYRTIRSMASGMAEQIRDIRHFADATAQMQNGLIITMADMVENRDSDTGAHVQKTAAYVKIILEGLRKKGYYPDKLTDKYISDVVMSAPLHDVGKISISDTILNKPGKLTDEEYTIMKTHTTEGKKIIEKAISTVKGENYLKEARNMAGYHHERWDGKGYPEGLKGEVIPLAARAMAVADVFDALSSPRVYKPAFPLQKTLDILNEGKGTQFDPKCIDVFMEALPEVKLILKKYHEEDHFEH
ncbi:MAG: HD domain-containing protein [Lachnospiraceae bacterium]|nr:HD domain-containing protein [Lachnospiraceae bacterium]